MQAQMNMKPQLISYAPHCIHLVKISEGIISSQVDALHFKQYFRYHEMVEFLKTNVYKISSVYKQANQMEDIDKCIIYAVYLPNLEKHF